MANLPTLEQWAAEAKLWRQAITVHGPIPAYVRNLTVVQDIVTSLIRYRQERQRG
jgi:hypothetical protein